MKLKRVLLCWMMAAGVSICSAQTVSVDSLKAILPQVKDDSTKVDMLLQISRSYLSSEPAQAIPYARDAQALATKLNYQKGVAIALKNIGIAYYQESKYIEALENWNASLAVFEELGDKSGIANLQSNIGAIYKNQGNDSKALEYMFNSLRNSELANEEFRITSALINIGSVYQHKITTHDKALHYYLRALPMSEQLKDNDLIGTTTVNIGEIYLLHNNPDSALFYFKKAENAFTSTVDIPYALNNIGKVYNQKQDFALAMSYHKRAYDSAVANDSKLYQTQALQGMASVAEQSGDHKEAIRYYKEADKLSKEINSSYDLKEVYAGLSRAYSKQKDFANAFRYQELLANIKDTIYNKETDLKLSNYEFNFEIEKKQGQINLLEKDKALQKADLEREKLAKNALIIGFAMILIIVFILYRNYRQKIKVNRLLDSQKMQIEQLLLNILPAEVAKELQVQGHATPRYYENVSVLFTDFKGFSSLAENLSPQEVVAELNDCFMAFDRITEGYNLEKIKTIGDSYMCAGGIPVKNNDHPISIIKAAIDIQRYMLKKNQKRQEEGLPLWELRVGIHTGPLVAGVVGKNKYAYDIWGRTVNIASRMESNGAPGEINISEATFELVKDVYHCTYRGKIYAKNVGEIDMYFVQGVYAQTLPETVNINEPRSSVG